MGYWNDISMKRPARLFRTNVIASARAPKLTLRSKRRAALSARTKPKLWGAALRLIRANPKARLGPTPTAMSNRPSTRIFPQSNQSFPKGATMLPPTASPQPLSRSRLESLSQTEVGTAGSPPPIPNRGDVSNANAN
jgi:hypothetical protein